MAQTGLDEDGIRERVRLGNGIITWWPGGPSHDVIAGMVASGELVARDVSDSQETRYEVSFAPDSGAKPR